MPAKIIQKNRKSFRKVKVDGHAKEVLAALKAVSRDQ